MVEDAWDGLLGLDFEIQPSSQEDHRFLVWCGGVHFAYPRAELPRGPSASPAPQEMGRAGGVQGSHTEILLTQCSPAQPSKRHNTLLLGKEGERP